METLTAHWRAWVGSVIYLVLVPAAIIALAVVAFINVQGNRDQARKNQQQIKVLRNALAETCHTSTLVLGIVNQLILYVQADTSNPRQVITVDALAGIGTDLGNLSACQTIQRP